MLVDTHAHINLHAFKGDADEVLQRSLAAGVVVINVGTEYSTSKQAVNMLEQYPDNVYAAVGLHPSHTYDNPYLDENESASAVQREEFDFEAYRQLAIRPKVVGVGECGLDYYRLPDDVSMHESIKRLQKEAFLQQVKLARELDKVLIIHCRPSKGTNDAYDDLLEILKGLNSSPREERLGEVIVKSGNQSKVSTTPSLREPEGPSEPRTASSSSTMSSEPNGPSSGGGQDLRFEIHSFTGSLEIAQKFTSLGGYIGLNGIITFDKTGNMETVVRGVPLDRIVLETDSPYLAPVPYRGKRNEPDYVEEVAQKIAEWKGITRERVARGTTENARQLFKLPI